MGKQAAEQDLTIHVEGRTVPGVVWLPPDARSPCPVVLVGVLYNHNLDDQFGPTETGLELFEYCAFSLGEALRNA